MNTLFDFFSFFNKCMQCVVFVQVTLVTEILHLNVFFSWLNEVIRNKAMQIVFK